MAPTPRRQPKTANETALEKRQQTALDKEIEEQEERLTLFTRKSLGRASLLSGAPKTAQQAAGKASSNGRMFGGSSMSSGATGGSSGGNVSSPRTLSRK